MTSYLLRLCYFSVEKEKRTKLCNTCEGDQNRLLVVLPGGFPSSSSLNIEGVVPMKPEFGCRSWRSTWSRPGEPFPEAVCWCCHRERWLLPPLSLCWCRLLPTEVRSLPALSAALKEAAELVLVCYNTVPTHRCCLMCSLSLLCSFRLHCAWLNPSRYNEAFRVPPCCCDAPPCSKVSGCFAGQWTENPL